MKRLAVWALLALPAGCALQRGVELPPLEGWQTRQQVLGGWRSWDFAGRIAVRDGEEGFNGRLEWRQRGRRFDVRISGPFGAGAVEIDGDPQRITVTDGDGAVTELSDAERDLRRRYGWAIPLASLRYWALGLPDPATPAVTRCGDAGRLAALRQGGWKVTIDAYGEAAGQPMPHRMTATRHDTRVRIVIDRWLFH